MLSKVSFPQVGVAALMKMRLNESLLYFTANPPATLKWTKNNDAASILPSPYLAEKYNEKSGEVELTLKQVSIQDAGRYTLTASNDLGVSSSVCDVVVKSRATHPFNFNQN